MTTVDFEKRLLFIFLLGVCHVSLCVAQDIEVTESSGGSRGRREGRNLSSNSSSKGEGSRKKRGEKKGEKAFNDERPAKRGKKGYSDDPFVEIRKKGREGGKPTWARFFEGQVEDQPFYGEFAKKKKKKK